MSHRKVDTVYGPVSGCEACGLIPLTRPLLCEHGVTPLPVTEVSVSIELSTDEYEALLWGRRG